MTQLLTSLYFSISLTQNTHNKEILNLQLNMAGIKYSYCSSVCETARGMTKHLSMCRVQWGIARHTIPYQIQCGINDFLTISEVEATLPLAEQIEVIYSNKEEEGPYINNVKRMNPVGTAEYAEKADGKQINPESMRIWLRSEIQLTQSRFKVIGFTNSEKG